MKLTVEKLLLFASSLLCLLASCTDEIVGSAENDVVNPGNVASMQEQISSMKLSLEDIAVVKAAMDPGTKDDPVISDMAARWDGIAAEICSHISEYERSEAWSEMSCATLSLQHRLAGISGTFRGCLENSDVSRQIEDQLSSTLDVLDERASGWLGSGFDCLYAVSVAQARVETVVSDLDKHIASQKYEVSRLLDGDLPEDLISQSMEMDSTLSGNAGQAGELTVRLDSLYDEVRVCYVQMIEASLVQPDKFDSGKLEKVNRNASAALKSTDNTLTDLIQRVADCEAAIASILERLEKLEEDVDAVLGMIQSLSFVSVHSGGSAVAYYELTEDSDGDGVMERKPVTPFELNYIITPASAASALVDPELWNNGLTVKGYYARSYQLYSAEFDFFNLKISDVTADSESGLVKVCVDNAFDNAFYYNETGARVALSIISGATDMTSGFVDVVPVDISNDVYVESLTMSESAIHVVKGETAQLAAIVTPEDATVKTCTWKSYDTEVVTVDAAGKLTGVKAGETYVEATTDGTDKSGVRLTARCKVIVEEVLEILGPSYVEVGSTAQMSIDCPSSMTIESAVWSTSNQNLATVTQDGLVTGIAAEYNDKTYSSIDVTCVVNGEITLVAEMLVVYVQPSGVTLYSLGDEEDRVVLKIDETFSLAGQICPSDVDQSQYHLNYRSADASVVKVDYYTGDVIPYSPGTTYVEIGVYDEQNYYAPGRYVKRVVTFDIEPYWVETISLPSSTQLEVGVMTSLDVELTSDVSGVQPTYKNVVWSSSDETVASVNRTTGEIVAKSAGTAYIRATASGKWVVKGGGELYAECCLTVSEPSIALNVGDFYYSDGTWSSALDPAKDVIGVVFAKVNSTVADQHVGIDCPECTHGLVVGLQEYTSSYRTDSWSMVNLLEPWLYENGYPQYSNVNAPVGYSNTKGVFAAEQADSSIDFTVFDCVRTYRTAVPAPPTASPWYLPSFKEMQLISENVATVNESLSKVSGGREISVGANAKYWCSTFDYNAYGTRPVVVNGSGNWYPYVQPVSTVNQVRVVLAF